MNEKEFKKYIRATVKSVVKEEIGNILTEMFVKKLVKEIASTMPRQTKQINEQIAKPKEKYLSDINNPVQNKSVNIEQVRQTFREKTGVTEQDIAGSIFSNMITEETVSAAQNYTPINSSSPSSPASVVDEQMGLNTEGDPLIFGKLGGMGANFEKMSKLIQ